MGKQDVRREAMAARLALTPVERADRSRRAQQALIESNWFRSANTVMLYLPFRGEVETDLLADPGKRLVLPRVQKEPRKLWLHLWEGEAEAGAYGIREPAASWPLVEPEEIDLVVVPGLAFDRAGNRLGYGGGYYDRALPLMTRAVKVGLAFALQVAERLPADPHDVRMDGIATEEGLIVCG